MASTSTRIACCCSTRSKNTRRLQHPVAGDGSRQADEIRGRQVDFRNVILIMTTNAGAADQAKAAIGFNRERREKTRMPRPSSAPSRPSSATVLTWSSSFRAAAAG